MNAILRTAGLLAVVVGVLFGSATLLLADGETPIEEQITTLVTQLGDAEFEVRERATEQLIALGPDALPLLRERVEQTADPEVRWRLERAIGTIESAHPGQPGTPDNQPEAQPEPDFKLERPGFRFEFRQMDPQRPEDLEKFMREFGFGGQGELRVDKLLEEMLKAMGGLEPDDPRSRPFGNNDLDRELEQLFKDLEQSFGLRPPNRPEPQQPGRTMTFQQSFSYNGVLGIGVRNLSPELAYHLKVEDGGGLLVDQVDRDSAASKAGLRKFDVVLRIDGHPVTEIGAFNVLRQDGEHTIDIVRAGERKTLTVDGDSSLPEQPRPRRF